MPEQDRKKARSRAGASQSLLRGRLSGVANERLRAFSSSLHFDRRMYRQDIDASIAHATGLEKAGILNSKERQDIVNGLKIIAGEIASGQFPWREIHEDIHINIEARLIELIGDTGGKLHTGRSRNDQVATDLRLYLREQIDTLSRKTHELQSAIVTLAERERETVMPGFTHTQIAQPVIFAHHLLAWFEALRRDCDRLKDTRKRLNYLPLGAAALAGTSFPLDREHTAQMLGFDGICRNSMDAVSDRDFVIELGADCALIMMHLSRFSEEIILWMSPLFNFVSLPDELCTGSSIMPQKKNPDLAELVRGKTGRVYGSLVSLLTLMKGQPLAYNRDNQEDKEPIFDALDTAVSCLEVMTLMVKAMKPNRKRMLETAGKGFSCATEIADWLVRQGLPFRRAHELTGTVVQLAASKGVALQELAVADLTRLSDEFAQFSAASLHPQACVASKKTPGGTAPEQIKVCLAEARDYLSQT